MKYYSHLNTAENILKQYTGSQPFALFIKDFFKADKKYGSKDRRRISALCYSFFRLGKIRNETSLKERILLGLFLASDSPDELLQAEKPEWNSAIHLRVTEKLELAEYQFSLADFFPAAAAVAGEIDLESFVLAHFIQPDLFLRIRPGAGSRVRSSLRKAGISYKEMGETCIALPNASRLENIISINRDAIIQDFSSQRVMELLQRKKEFTPKRVWDCCAASGGKSLLIHDHYPTAELTVSDVRENILVNLSKRFREAGIRAKKAFVADLSKPIHPGTLFDLIVADVPCSGSGTWGRTPEQLLFFEESRIMEYAIRQRQIISNTWKHLKPGAYLLYITCSVYAEENQGAVDYALKNTPLQLEEARLFQGYEKKADTLFAALLRLPV